MLNTQKSLRLSNEYKTGAPIKALTRIVLGVDTTSLHDTWVSLYEFELTHRGKLEAIKYMKSLYGQAVSYSLFQQIPHIPFRKTIKCGLVRDLKHFKPYLRGSVPKTRAALTILRQYELLYTEPSYDLSTVTDPCTKSSLWYRWAFIRWLKKTDRTLPVISFKEPKDHLTSKKGPSGSAAMTSWDEDILALPQRLIDDICRLSELLGDAGLTDRIGKLKQLLIAKGFTSKNECHSRIQVFPAGGGKTRIIAIYDYWSQRTLRSLHQAMFRGLRKVNEDATFGHHSAADWLKSVPKGVDIYSYDLTAATDRIPYWIHDQVLRQHLPKTVNRDEIADLCKSILLNRKFKLSWDPSKEVSYECGQPMGAYMSWALLAYSHHCIARFCGARRNEYRIIGDDIVILGKAGLKYKRFLDAFDIKISESKSIISYRESKHQTGEVAKRLILDGVEISPPTPNLIYKTFRDWRLAPMLLEDMVRRGWELQTDTLLGLLHSMYSKRWTQNVITVLSFPFASCEAALLLKGVVDAVSVWKEYSITELAINFVRYRIALLYKAERELSSSYEFGILFGAAPIGTDKDIYALSPVKTIRKQMMDQTIKIAKLFAKFERDILLEGGSDIVLPAIRDEELYCPDLNLNFLEKKYQRQQYYSNTLLTMKRKIDNGTLDKWMDQYNSY